MSEGSSATNNARLTPTMMVQLAAPHTWSAAIMPVVVGVAYAISVGSPVSLPLAAAMLAISILMQSAVNTFNDYMDYRTGTDTLDNQLDPTDAVLVYNNVSPRSVFVYFLGLMAAALVLGIIVVLRSSWITLVIGLLAAASIVAYSAGKTPLSYLPLGELVSGLVMGGFITLATCYVLIGEFTLFYLVVALPLIVSIGLINMTNNTCDIEKDVEAERRTIPVLLGRKRAKQAYVATMFAIEILIYVLVGAMYLPGIAVCVMMSLAFYPGFKALKANPLVLESRGAAMAQVVTLNVTLNAFYALALVAGSHMAVVL